MDIGEEVEVIEIRPQPLPDVSPEPDIEPVEDEPVEVETPELVPA